jgi:hypothetical protein
LHLVLAALDLGRRPSYSGQQSLRSGRMVGTFKGWLKPKKPPDDGGFFGERQERLTSGP